MKKSYFLLAIILLSAIASFPFFMKEFTGNNISISISEDEKELSISAKFPENETQKVRNYLDKQLTKHGDLSFTNAEIDANVTLDDKTIFYIKSLPGKLKIEFDKRKNSTNAYLKMKQFGEGIKKVLAGK